MSNRKNTSNKFIPAVQSANPGRSARWLRVSAGILLIAIAAFIVYFPSINGDFILDDDGMLTDNLIIKASDGLFRFWCTTEAFDYWPLSNSTLWIEWRLWRMNPTGYRVTNLILHVAEALLIWIILRKIAIPGAFLAAMIFTVHPVNVDSVAWISQRKDMMALLFFLFSILCYIKYSSHSARLLWYWLSLAAFILAMLSKGSVAVLPVFLLGIVWWIRSGTVPIFEQQKWDCPLYLRDLLNIMPFFLVSAVLTVVNMWFQTHDAEVVIRAATFTERLLGAGGVVWFYLYKALLPLDLSYVYPQWNIQTGNLLWWLPLLSVLIVAAVLWRHRERWGRPLIFAFGYFCVSLAPVMGIKDTPFMHCSLVADHYQYIAIIGVIALAAAGWSAWRESMRGGVYRATTVVAILAVGVLAFLTWRQSGLYRDAITLYQATLEKNPSNHIVQYSLGLALNNAGRLDEGIKHYEEAVRLKPDYLVAQNDLGFALGKAGRLEEAIEHLRQAVAIKPDNADARYNLGLALLKTNRSLMAIEQFEQVLLLKPNYPEAHNNLGFALSNLDRSREAIEHYEQALMLNPNYPEAHNNLGIVFVKAGRVQEGIDHFEKALRLKPDYINAIYNLALAYANMDKSSEAIASAQKALELARSKGQTLQAEHIENWLKSYRASLSELPNKPPPSNPVIQP